jgi:hypothetical protein
LDFNDFGNFGTQAIAAMLRRNRHLKELHLFGNQIDAEGAHFLADSLHHNISLKTLILSFNDIGDEGIKALGNALIKNSTLTKLWFPSNGIGSDGLIAFGELLPEMKGLEQLNVGDFFDAHAAYALLQGLKWNTRLSVLYLQSPICESYGCTVEQEMDFFLRLNRSGRSLLQSPSAPCSLWPVALAKANKNRCEDGSPDVLYHLLRQKPELVGFPR